MQKYQLKGTLFLLLAAIIWGFSTAALKVGSKSMGPFGFTGYRSLLGGLSLIPVWMSLDRKKSPEQKAMECDKITLLRGSFISGLTMLTFTLAQFIGLPYTTIGKAGFITALYIVMIPVLGLFMGKRVKKNIWIAVTIAMSGFYLMCMTGGDISINQGDAMMLLAAFGSAIYVYVVDHYVHRVDPVKFSCFQFLTAGAICTALSLLLEHTTAKQISTVFWPLLYSGVCSCGLGYTCQIVGQRYMEPAKSSLLLSSETIFTMLAGMLFFREILTMKEYLGCALIFIAMIISQIQRKS